MTILELITHKYTLGAIIVMLIIVLIVLNVNKKATTPCPTSQSCPTSPSCPTTQSLLAGIIPPPVTTAITTNLLEPTIPSVDMVAQSVGLIAGGDIATQPVTNNFTNTCDTQLNNLTDPNEIKTYCNNCVVFDSVDKIENNMFCFINQVFKMVGISTDDIQTIIINELDKEFNIYTADYSGVSPNISKIIYMLGFYFDIMLLLYPRNMVKNIIANVYIFMFGLSNSMLTDKPKIFYKYIANENENIHKLYYKIASSDAKDVYENCAVISGEPSLQKITSAPCGVLDIDNVVNEYTNSYDKLNNLINLPENIKSQLMKILYKFIAVNYYATINYYYLDITEYKKVGKEGMDYVVGTDIIMEKINLIYKKTMVELNSFLLVNKTILEQNNVYDNLKELFNTKVNNIQTLLQNIIVGTATSANIDKELIMDEIVNTLSQYIIEENIDLSAIDPDRIAPVIINQTYNMLSNISDENVTYFKKNAAMQIKSIIEKYKEATENGPQYRNMYIYNIEQPTEDIMYVKK